MPFDWVISNLDFIYDVIESLYDKPIRDVLDIFYDMSNTSVHAVETESMVYKTVFHIAEDVRTVVYNRKYKVTFNHNLVKDKTINSVIFERRLQRLKELLLNQNEFIRFLYVDRNPMWKYNVDGIYTQENAEPKLNKLSEYLQTKRKNFDILVVKIVEDRTLIDPQLIPTSKIKKTESELLEMYLTSLRGKVKKVWLITPYSEDIWWKGGVYKNYLDNINFSTIGFD